MKKFLPLLALSMLSAQTTSESQEIILDRSMQQEWALIRSQMQALQFQMDNLRLRACVQADAGKECGAWVADGRPVIIRLPAPPPQKSQK